MPGCTMLCTQSNTACLDTLQTNGYTAFYTMFLESVCTEIVF